MLQDIRSIRYYQKLTDPLVDFKHRGYRFEELKMYIRGYISCLGHADALEPYQVHRLEEEADNFLQDQSNFELPLPEAEAEYH